MAEIAERYKVGTGASVIVEFGPSNVLRKHSPSRPRRRAQTGGSRGCSPSGLNPTRECLKALADLDGSCRVQLVDVHIFPTEVRRRRILERTARGRADAERPCSATRESGAVASCSTFDGAVRG
jgi:hypothetical protein